MSTTLHCSVLENIISKLKLFHNNKIQYINSESLFQVLFQYKNNLRHRCVFKSVSIQIHDWFFRLKLQMLIILYQAIFYIWIKTEY